MAFIRKIKTASGATAVQIAYKAKGRIFKIIHVGSAHNQEELEILIELAHKWLLANQMELFSEVRSTLQVRIKKPFSGLLWNFLREEYSKLGFNAKYV